MDEFSSARPNTKEGASQGAQSCKAYVSSRFAFWITASWGAQSHNMLLRVVSCCMVCPIPELRLCNNKYIICHATFVCYCVSRGTARKCLHLDACTSHRKDKLPRGQAHLPLSLQSPCLQRKACTTFVPRPLAIAQRLMHLPVHLEKLSTSGAFWIFFFATPLPFSCLSLMCR